MKRKCCYFLAVCLSCICLAGCSNSHDTVDIYYKSNLIFDDIKIEIKDGYFYDKHEKFTVDENTIGITIYFSTEEDNSWE